MTGFTTSFDPAERDDILDVALRNLGCPYSSEDIGNSDDYCEALEAIEINTRPPGPPT